MSDLSTVGELVDYLATQPRDRKIIMSSDSEGNSYSPLADADEGMYFAESTSSGDVYPTPEELAVLVRDRGFDPEDDAAPDAAERVVVLGPVN